MLTLYHDNCSYSAQKVRVYLAEKKVKWQSHHIDLLKQEHITNESYRLINPRGLVPTLEDNGKIICNSTEIMEYIDATYFSGVTKFNDEISADIHDFCKNDEQLHDPHIRILSYYYLWMSKMPDNEEKNRLLELAARHPDISRGKFLARAIQRQITAEELDCAKKAISNALDDMEHRLRVSKNGFILWNAYTMADSVATVRLFRFERLNIKIAQYPLTAEYYERMKLRNSFAEIQV